MTTIWTTTTTTSTHSLTHSSHRTPTAAPSYPDSRVCIYCIRCSLLCVLLLSVAQSLSSTKYKKQQHRVCLIRDMCIYIYESLVGLCDVDSSSGNSIHSYFVVAARCYCCRVLSRFMLLFSIFMPLSRFIFFSPLVYVSQLTLSEKIRQSKIEKLKSFHARSRKLFSRMMFAVLKGFHVTSLACLS